MKVQDDSNPVRKARLSLEMTKTAFALAIGLSYQQLVNAENGRLQKLGIAWEARLNKLGLNGEAISREYEAWIRAQAAAKLPSQVGGVA